MGWERTVPVHPCGLLGVMAMFTPTIQSFAFYQTLNRLRWFGFQVPIHFYILFFCPSVAPHPSVLSDDCIWNAVRGVRLSSGQRNKLVFLLYEQLKQSVDHICI